MATFFIDPAANNCGQEGRRHRAEAARASPAEQMRRGGGRTGDLRRKPTCGTCSKFEKSSGASERDQQEEEEEEVRRNRRSKRSRRFDRRAHLFDRRQRARQR
mmetsp:Transcript_49166/g.154354  ORF Transcript_49166/g.154354 Transcript_49166/m.154354 type:complete len:103 (+) Transcript_49166:2858-3166(+)